VLGFAWAFRAAGCPSVVTTLWEVNDDATSRLVSRFYRELKAGRAKDVALQRAMLSLLRDPETRRPYYWAAFRLTGDTAPLPAQRPLASLSAAPARSGRSPGR
jgi:CHAT domain-containing protein